VSSFCSYSERKTVGIIFVAPCQIAELRAAQSWKARAVPGDTLSASVKRGIEEGGIHHSAARKKVTLQRLSESAAQKKTSRLTLLVPVTHFRLSLLASVLLPRFIEQKRTSASTVVERVPVLDSTQACAAPEPATPSHPCAALSRRVEFDEGGLGPPPSSPLKKRPTEFTCSQGTQPRDRRGPAPSFYSGRR
jgi:hypothetical protein